MKIKLNRSFWSSASGSELQRNTEAQVCRGQGVHWLHRSQSHSHLPRAAKWNTLHINCLFHRVCLKAILSYSAQGEWWNLVKNGEERTGCRREKCGLRHLQQHATLTQSPAFGFCSLQQHIQGLKTLFLNLLFHQETVCICYELGIRVGCWGPCIELTLGSSLQASERNGQYEKCCYLLIHGYQGSIQKNTRVKIKEKLCRGAPLKLNFKEGV